MKTTHYFVLLLLLTCLLVIGIPSNSLCAGDAQDEKPNQESPMLTQTCCPIVELRQYTLQPGKRDDLIEIFDREFVESQEELGMRIIGQFQDLDNPNRFVWLRGFPDMPARAEALTAFYSGPVWKANRNEANATMVDVNNVLLLRPALPTSGFQLENFKRPPAGTTKTPQGLAIATIYYLDAAADADFIEFFERRTKPVLTNAGALILAYFVTENSANNFPALPVREGEYVFVWFSLFQDDTEYEHYITVLAKSPEWRDEISKAMSLDFKKSPEVLRLMPTARSLLQK